jgi:Ca2+-binding EF-hand superfamily protein
MVRAFFLTLGIALAAPALAQVGPTPQKDAAQSNTQDNAALPATSGDGVASIVETEFPAYDQNHDSQLDKAEFARWMVALKNQEIKATGKTLASAEITAWSDGAFVTADTDKSGTVSKPELIGYLSGGTG